MNTPTRPVVPLLVSACTLLGCVSAAAAQQAVLDPVKAPLNPSPPPPKIEPALMDAVSGREDGETVAVGIWFALPDYQVIRQLHLAEPTSDEERAELSAVVNERIAQGGRPLITALAGKALFPTYVSSHAPVICASLDKSTIEELAEREDVLAIYLSKVYEVSIEHAAKTDRADVVWARGIDGGATIDIAVVEVPETRLLNDSRIVRPHNYLAGPNDATTAFMPGNLWSDHATRVAGRIAALRQAGAPDRWRGVAPGVPALLSANAVSGADANIIAATDWALAPAQHANILNLSLNSKTDFAGVPRLLDRYCDFVVNEYLVTVTISAGNEGTNPAHVVSWPALSYNTITVGSYEDHDDNDWTGDSMSAGSSFRDPPDAAPAVGRDRELPEVVAVGATVESTDHNGGIGAAQSGTSFAAPAVAGIAALVMERDISLVAFPQTVKAIIMAGACHNIEGSSRLSDRDGAGGVVAAYRPAHRHQDPRQRRDL